MKVWSQNFKSHIQYLIIKWEGKGSRTGHQGSDLRLGANRWATRSSAIPGLARHAFFGGVWFKMYRMAHPFGLGLIYSFTIEGVTGWEFILPGQKDADSFGWKICAALWPTCAFGGSKQCRRLTNNRNRPQKTWPQHYLSHRKRGQTKQHKQSDIGFHLSF